MLDRQPETSPPDWPPPISHRWDVERLIAETMVSRGIRESRVLDAIRRVPRHDFVPSLLVRCAYEDRPLPIGWGQTISQPYIVALMTEAAQPKSSDRCLEIGTGCGYQTAVLSLLCREIYSIEYLAELFERAQANLEATGLAKASLHLRHGDGYLGWPDAAPFDVIIVTAAPPLVPEALLAQLAPGGRLILPIGRQFAAQRLERWTRTGLGNDRASFLVEFLLDVRFVPMVGEVQHQWRRDHA